MLGCGKNHIQTRSSVLGSHASFEECLAALPCSTLRRPGSGRPDLASGIQKVTLAPPFVKYVHCWSFSSVFINCCLNLCKDLYDLK